MLSLSKAIQNLIININKRRSLKCSIFFLDNIFVLFGGRMNQQTIGIPMDTNCATLPADLFLHAYEADFLQGVLNNKDRKLNL